MTKIKILIVDDHAVLRAGIRALLDLQADFEVIGEASDGQAAISCVRELHPDVVIMDIGMPGLDGLASTRQIKLENPNTHILFLTQHENKEYILPALKIGASGYVLKRAEGNELLTAIRTVFSGGTYLDPAISSIIANDIRRDNLAATDPYEELSDREREVFMMLAQGHTYQQIGNTLFISPKTVDFHRANILRKLGLSSRSDLTKYAVQRGLFK